MGAAIKLAPPIGDELNQAVSFLQSHGWTVTCARLTCACSNPRCAMDCGLPRYLSVRELRDPVKRRYVRSWRNAYHQQLQREAGR